VAFARQHPVSVFRQESPERVGTKDIEELGEVKFRQRTAKHPKLEEALTLWVNQTTKGKAGTVNDAFALKKAQELGELLGIRDFSYSKGWLLNWKKRSGIKCHKQHVYLAS
jgi:hypothetical protein